MKTSPSDLAICGGTPSFQEPVHVGRPNIPNTEKFLSLAEDMFRRKWFSNNGPYVQELESELRKFLGVKHCIPVCNGTIALEIATRAAGLGGEVIVPSFTFIATAHALQWQEITPVFCDIDPKTHLLDPECAERAITPRTTGIIPVHVWGQTGLAEVFEEVGRRHGLKIIFDAAHAFGCSHGDRMIGNFGHAEVFSFHATKFFNSFEGGAIATNDDDLAHTVRLMKNFGFAGYDDSVLVGTNGKMTEICAAMGLASLDSLEDYVSVNREHYKEYSTGLNGIPGLTMLSYNDCDTLNYQHIVVDNDPALSPLTRDDLMNVLWRENVLARRYFYPGCHRMLPYQSRNPDLQLPATDRVSAGILILPTGTALSRNDVAKICSIVRVAMANPMEVIAQLHS